MQDSWAYWPIKILEIGQRVCPCEATLYQKVYIFHILGPHSYPPVPIEKFWLKFCTAKRTHVPVGRAKFHVNRCNELPLHVEKPDFRPVSKLNTSSLHFAQSASSVLHVFQSYSCHRQ